MRTEKTVPAKPTYSLLDLTEEQFDIIVGCVKMAEYGGTDRGKGVPYKQSGQVHNGLKRGGAAVFEQIDPIIRDESSARLDSREVQW